MEEIKFCVLTIALKILNYLCKGAPANGETFPGQKENQYINL